ncbi:iron-sulfur cluster biosynthesis family protein [Aquibacillus sediminis]|uniref:iron-sulfur cluster biosynthesis family protein n=1 Tax=Aquibacillus sediminis TaxID=2574734 RepID=UPI001109172D|nr:iron-sulfur cluster biosynthesis family protein [Aquibacillus sediminis]
MQLEITANALEKMEQMNSSDYEYLMLYYDTDDCGCGVNGVPTIRLTNKKEDSFIDVDSDDFQVIIHHQQAVFFAKQMKLDLIGGRFRLSSPEGILNPIIPANDLVKGDVA